MPKSPPILNPPMPAGFPFEQLMGTGAALPKVQTPGWITPKACILLVAGFKKYSPPIGGPICKIKPGGVMQAWILVIFPPNGLFNLNCSKLSLDGKLDGNGGRAAAAKEGASKDIINAGTRTRRVLFNILLFYYNFNPIF